MFLMTSEIRYDVNYSVNTYPVHGTIFAYPITDKRDRFL